MGPSRCSALRVRGFGKLNVTLRVIMRRDASHSYTETVGAEHRLVLLQQAKLSDFKNDLLVGDKLNLG
jgi:hypothetical protein